MTNKKIIQKTAIVVCLIGSWLLLWDFMQFLTQGLNDYIWDFSVLQKAVPSIFFGACLVLGGVILSFINKKR